MGDVERDLGASFGPGSRASTEPQSTQGLGPSGFNPSRGLVVKDREGGVHYFPTARSHRTVAIGSHLQTSLHSQSVGLGDALAVFTDIVWIKAASEHRDSDGSGEAGETAQTGSTVGDSAGRETASPKDTRHDQ